MDIEMPVMNGYEATQKIREQGGRHVRILGCSGYDGTEFISRCLERGMDEVISKPIVFGEELFVKMEKYLF